MRYGRLLALALTLGAVLTFGVGTAAAEVEKPYSVGGYSNAPRGIVVTWVYGGDRDDIQGFTLYWQNANGTYTFRGSAGNGLSSFQDLGLEPSTAYQYVVCAVSYANELGQVDEVCADQPSPPIRTMAPEQMPAMPAPTRVPPPTPLLRGTARSASEIYLTWQFPGYEARLTSAKLYRDGAAIYEALIPGNFDSDHVDVVQQGSTHGYHVCFRNPDGETCSAPITRSPTAPPPAAPTNVRVGDFAAGSLVIRWQPGAGADEYNIHCLDLTDNTRCGFPYVESGGRMGVDRVRNADQPVTATSYYTLANLRAGHRYEVAVCASQDRLKYGLAVNPTACAPGLIVTGDGNQEFCMTGACRIVQIERRMAAGQAAPGNPTGTLSADRLRIDLRWTASPGATSYELEILNQDSGFFTRKTLPANATSYTDEIGPNQTGEYVYQLKACGAAGCSAVVTVVVRL